MNKKIKNNAICSYLGLAFLLLIPQKNELINNDFVKKHSKTAIIIHILFFITYYVFIKSNFLYKYNILGFNLADVIAVIIFIFLFLLLLLGSYKANNGEYFLIKDITKKTKTDGLISIKNSGLNEEGSLSLSLSLVPFLGFILRGKFRKFKSRLIENNLKLNLILTSSLIIIYYLGYKNIGALLLLLLIIFIVFYSIFMIINKKVISINLDKVPNFEEIIILKMAFIKYIHLYFGKNKFRKFRDIYLEIYENNKDFERLNREKLLKLRPNKLPEIIYILPIINLIGIIDYNSQAQNYVKNGIIISILFSLIYLFLDNTLIFFVIILCFYTYGYQKNIEYQIPVLGKIFNFFENIFHKFFNKINKAKEISKKVEQKTFKL